MEMTSKQKEILGFIERNSCTEIGQDDAFQDALTECESERDVTELLRHSACYLGLVAGDCDDWIEEMGCY